MGCSLIFTRMRGGQEIDADRDGLASWLEKNRLTLGPGCESAAPFLNQDGVPLQLDGRASDLHLDSLDSSDKVSAGFGTRDSESKNAP